MSQGLSNKGKRAEDSVDQNLLPVVAVLDGQLAHNSAGIFSLACRKAPFLVVVVDGSGFSVCSIFMTLYHRRAATFRTIASAAVKAATLA